MTKSSMIHVVALAKKDRLVDAISDGPVMPPQDKTICCCCCCCRIGCSDWKLLFRLLLLLVDEESTAGVGDSLCRYGRLPKDEVDDADALGW